LTLTAIGDHFGFSRERARQVEARAKEKLRLALSGLRKDLQDGERPHEERRLSAVA
jgi:RNA polymerase sigma-32 factor